MSHPNAFVELDFVYRKLWVNSDNGYTIENYS